MASVDNFHDFNQKLNESLFDKPEFKSIEEIFTYQQPHETAIGNQLLDILMEERGVSEKAFEALTDLKGELEAAYEQHPEIREIIQEFKRLGKRDRFCAEHIFDTYLKA